jgi:hypothetical protein
MLRRLAIVLLGAAVLTGVAPLFGADEKPPTGLKPQAELPNLPGPFEVYAVTGEHAGHFHSPVCAHGLHPLVLVFFRENTDINGTARDGLLKPLEKAIADHPLALAGGCAIVLNDRGYRNALENKTDDLLRAMQERDTAAATLRNLANSMKLKHITVALDRAGGPEGYKIGDKANVTVLVCYRDKIAGRYTFDHELTSRDEGALQKIVKQFEDITAKVQNDIRPPRRRR